MRTGRDRVSLLAPIVGKRHLVTGYRDFCPTSSALDASSFGESYGIHSLPYTRARSTATRRRDAMQRDARHSLRRNVTLASVQYPRSSSSSRASGSLSLNRASRKIYLETVTIIRAAADAARPDGCETFCVEWIVSRPFHGHFPCDREKFFGGSQRRSSPRETSPEFFPPKLRNAMRLHRREIKPLRVKCN